MDKSMVELAERYLRNSATPEEAGKVLEWFQSEEGKHYLAERFSRDLQQIEDGKFPLSVSADPARTYRKIESRMKRAESVRPINRMHRHPALRAVAACALLLLAILAYLKLHIPSEPAGPEPVKILVHATGEDEKKIIRLSDGTSILLNANSRIEMPEVFRTSERNVRLEGQAYFEVSADPDRPFIVRTSAAEVRVLGTEFNVKESSRSGEVYVAVAQGKVMLSALEPKGESASKIRSVLLEKNMLGLVNPRTGQVTREDSDVHNYLSWIHGRIVFERTPFSRVVDQLERIYEFDSRIADESLLELRLTADFSEQSPENVLDVIAHSLDLEYWREGETLLWKKTNP